MRYARLLVKLRSMFRAGSTVTKVSAKRAGTLIKAGFSKARPIIPAVIIGASASLLTTGISSWFRKRAESPDTVFGRSGSDVSVSAALQASSAGGFLSSSIHGLTQTSQNKLSNRIARNLGRLVNYPPNSASDRLLLLISVQFDLTKLIYSFAEFSDSQKTTDYLLRVSALSYAGLRPSAGNQFLLHALTLLPENEDGAKVMSDFAISTLGELAGKVDFTPLGYEQLD